MFSQKIEKLRQIFNQSECFDEKKTMNGKRNKFVVINKTRLKSLSSLLGSAKYDKKYIGFQNVYRKVTSPNTSCLEAHAGFFRLLINRILILMYCEILTKS